MVQSVPHRLSLRLDATANTNLCSAFQLALHGAIALCIGSPQNQNFDDDGNLSVNRNGDILTWNEKGQLASFQPSGGDLVQYGYDANGKRLWRKEFQSGGVHQTLFIYDGPNRIAEYAFGSAPSSARVEFAYAGGIDPLVMVARNNGSQKLLVTRNQQWSITSLTNLGGYVVERYTYDIFGERTILYNNGRTGRVVSAFDNPYGYTSRRHDDETGLMYFRTRHYDPETGEFVSQDPLEYVDGMSLYRAYFVPGGTDPEGLAVTPNCAIACGNRINKNGSLWEKANYIDCVENCENFVRWYDEAKNDLSWISSLPGCPCTITSGAGEERIRMNPDPDVWVMDDNPNYWGDFHPGADRCLRTKATGSGEQCCYDRAGKLITSGLGAGSADKSSPSNSWYNNLFQSTGHYAVDVEPFHTARLLDGVPIGIFTKMYIEVRPANNKRGCPANPS